VPGPSSPSASSSHARLWLRGLTTFADLFRQRYSAGVEQLAVLVLLPGSVIWVAHQVRAFGQVLSANSGLGLAAVLAAAYSVVGGLLADAVTDVVQGLAVLLGLVILGGVDGTVCHRPRSAFASVASRMLVWAAGTPTPYLTGPYLTGPYLTGPYLTGPYLTGPYLTGLLAAAGYVSLIEVWLAT
jgi:Sodium:solute symporter family